MTYRVRNIVVAVGLALVAMLLTTFYVTNYKRHVRQSESTATVYVAKKDIPVGTPGGDLLKQGFIGTEQVVQRTVVPGAISNPDQVQSLITTDAIYSGEQVSLRRFADHAEQGVRSQLHGPLRALSLPGTSDELLAGTLRDGDHVDVIANLKVGDCTTCYAVRDIAQDVLVLQAPTAAAGAHVGSSSNAASVVLAVSDAAQEQKIWYAVENSAGWTLALRPVANATNPSIDVESIASMLRDGAPASAAASYGGH